MCGSGTTLDVCRDLKRRGLGFDLNPQRPEIKRNDSRKLPLDAESVDFVFIDPPYSTHVDYSDDARCIGKLDSGGDDGGRAYYRAMEDVIREIHRVLKPGRYMGLYVSDSWRKKKGPDGKNVKGAEFMPIGFELFAIMRKYLTPVDIICVVRHNKKLSFGNWRKAAEEGNFFLRGFNYCFIMRRAGS
jgi:DNA modification methylase